MGTAVSCSSRSPTGYRKTPPVVHKDSRHGRDSGGACQPRVPWVSWAGTGVWSGSCGAWVCGVDCHLLPHPCCRQHPLPQVSGPHPGSLLAPHHPFLCRLETPEHSEAIRVPLGGAILHPFAGVSVHCIVGDVCGFSVDHGRSDPDCELAADSSPWSGCLLSRPSFTLSFLPTTSLLWPRTGRCTLPG